MALMIDPEGYYHGKRMTACSDIARLYWPSLFLAADGFGRLELDFEDLIYRCFRGFENPPTEDKLRTTFMEYRERHLAFLYEAAGRWWCQWWLRPRCTPRFIKVKDKESPEPPADEYQRWLKSYPPPAKPLSGALRNLSLGFPKDSEELSRGSPNIPHEESRGVLSCVVLSSEETHTQSPVVEDPDFLSYAPDNLEIWLRANYPRQRQDWAQAKQALLEIATDAGKEGAIKRGIEAWKQSDEWRRGVIPNLSRFLSELYFDRPPESGECKKPRLTRDLRHETH